MSVAPEITWLFVSTTPPGSITKPVPAPTALLNPKLVLMLTTCGATVPAGSSGGAGRSLNRSSASVGGPGVVPDAGAVARPRLTPIAASTLTDRDHQRERWGHLLIP